jgi:hypothetical protein
MLDNSRNHASEEQNAYQRYHKSGIRAQFELLTRNDIELWKHKADNGDSCY